MLKERKKAESQICGQFPKHTKPRSHQLPSHLFVMFP